MKFEFEGVRNKRDEVVAEVVRYLEQTTDIKTKQIEPIVKSLVGLGLIERIGYYLAIKGIDNGQRPHIMVALITSNLPGTAEVIDSFIHAMQCCGGIAKNRKTIDEPSRLNIFMPVKSAGPCHAEKASCHAVLQFIKLYPTVERVNALGNVLARVTRVSTLLEGPAEIDIACDNTVDEAIEDLIASLDCPTEIVKTNNLVTLKISV